MSTKKEELTEEELKEINSGSAEELNGFADFLKKIGKHLKDIWKK